MNYSIKTTFLSMKNEEKSLFGNKDKIDLLRRILVVSFVFIKSVFKILTRENFNDKVKPLIKKMSLCQ